MTCLFCQRLPKGISALRNLRVLDLEGNKLKYLVTEISYLKELQKLNVQSNCITNLPRRLGSVWLGIVRHTLTTCCCVFLFVM